MSCPGFPTYVVGSHSSLVLEASVSVAPTPTLHQKRGPPQSDFPISPLLHPDTHVCEHTWLRAHIHGLPLFREGCHPRLLRAASLSHRGPQSKH